jgi:hypothetical protein
MFVLAGVLLWRARQVGKPAPGELTIEQATVLDSLLRETYDHIERGTALLSIGASAQALREFADGINILQVHPLRSHPAVAPRILALEGAVAGIYRENKLAVPSGFVAGRPAGTLLSTALAASLTAADFRLRFEEVRSLFQGRFGQPLVVTGSDHSEHLSLYGPGGALDLRSRDLSADRIQFIIAECRLRRIRVKDFSKDSVLRAQIAAALQAGLADRASTGVHLHIDRFAGRRDRWTVD